MRPAQFSEQALADLEAIYRHIETNSQVNAISFTRKLRQTCTDRGYFPEASPRRRHLGKTYRVFPYKNYLIVYSIFADHIRIDRILHSARDFKRAMRSKH